MRGAARGARPPGRWVTLGPPLHFLGLRWGLSWAESSPKAVWSLWPPWPAVTLTLSHRFPCSLQPGLAPAFRSAARQPSSPAGAGQGRWQPEDVWCQDGLPFGQFVPGRGAADVGICPDAGTLWGVCEDGHSLALSRHTLPTQGWSVAPGALSMPREGWWPVRMEGSPQLLPDGEQERGRHLSSQQLPLTGPEGATHLAGALFGVPAPPTQLQSPHPPGGHPPPPLGLPGVPVCRA